MNESSFDLSAMMPLIPPAIRQAIHIGLDDLPFLDLGDGSAIQLLHADLSQGLWVLRTRLQPGYRVDRHYHTGPVFALTTAGAWHYLEYPNQVNRAGSYLFEPAGSIHTLAVHPEAEGVTEVCFIVFGANVNLTKEGGVANILDAATITRNYRGLCEAMGLDASALLVEGDAAAG